MNDEPASQSSEQISLGSRGKQKEQLLSSVLGFYLSLAIAVPYVILKVTSLGRQGGDESDRSGDHEVSPGN